jgi:signal peptidase
MAVLASTARRMVGLLCRLTILFAITYTVLPFVGYHPLAVYSGSMVPALPVGTLAIDQSVAASSVRPGDVITFNDPYVHGRVVTHRVVRVIHTDHGLAYRTKGDANPAVDPWLVQLPGSVGRVAFQVPYAGYALVYAQTREIRMLLLLLVSSSLLVFVLRGIWRRPDSEVTPAIA